MQIQSLYGRSSVNTLITSELIEAISSRVARKVEEKFGSVLSNAQSMQRQPEVHSGSLNNATATFSGTRRRERDEECDEHDRRKQYKLSRDLTNVISLWREWSVGLGDGRPSVASLNEEYGSKG